MTKKLKLLATDYHRNGVCGAGFSATLFKDKDGTTKLCIDFGHDSADDNAANPRDGDYYAVLQVDLLAKGDVAFGSNSWRGDHYVDDIRKLRKPVMDRRYRALKKSWAKPVTTVELTPHVLVMADDAEVADKVAAALRRKIKRNN